MDAKSKFFPNAAQRAFRCIPIEWDLASTVLTNLTYFSSPMIAFFLMLGAVAYSGRTVPRWLLGTFLSISGLRMILASIGQESAAQVISLGSEVPAQLVAAYLVLTGRQSANSALVTPLLAAGPAGPGKKG